MIENQELLDQAVLGRQVEDFLLTDVGKFLLAKAENEYIMALQALSEVDASNVQLILQHQGDAKTALNFRAWLSEAVTSGLKAKEILEERDYQ
jgi:hypothetical protein